MALGINTLPLLCTKSVINPIGEGKLSELEFVIILFLKVLKSFLDSKIAIFA